MRFICIIIYICSILYGKADPFPHPSSSFEVRDGPDHSLGQCSRGFEIPPEYSWNIVGLPGKAFTSAPLEYDVERVSITVQVMPKGGKFAVALVYTHVELGLLYLRGVYHNNEHSWHIRSSGDLHDLRAITANSADEYTFDIRLRTIDSRSIVDIYHDGQVSEMTLEHNIPLVRAAIILENKDAKALWCQLPGAYVETSYSPDYAAYSLGSDMIYPYKEDKDEKFIVYRLANSIDTGISYFRFNLNLENRDPTQVLLGVGRFGETAVSSSVGFLQGVFYDGVEITRHVNSKNNRDPLIDETVIIQTDENGTKIKFVDNITRRVNVLTGLPMDLQSISDILIVSFGGDIPLVLEELSDEIDLTGYDVINTCKVGELCEPGFECHHDFAGLGYCKPANHCLDPSKCHSSQFCRNVEETYECDFCNPIESKCEDGYHCTKKDIDGIFRCHEADECETNSCIPGKYCRDLDVGFACDSCESDSNCNAGDVCVENDGVKECAVDPCTTETCIHGRCRALSPTSTVCDMCEVDADCINMKCVKSHNDNMICVADLCNLSSCGENQFCSLVITADDTAVARCDNCTKENYKTCGKKEECRLTEILGEERYVCVDLETQMVVVEETKEETETTVTTTKEAPETTTTTIYEESEQRNIAAALAGAAIATVGVGVAIIGGAVYYTKNKRKSMLEDTSFDDGDDMESAALDDDTEKAEDLEKTYDLVYAIDNQPSLPTSELLKLYG